jgi:Micrococcal nuclease (thermonuclease) homologs
MTNTTSIDSGWAISCFSLSIRRHHSTTFIGGYWRYGHGNGAVRAIIESMIDLLVWLWLWLWPGVDQPDDSSATAATSLSVATATVAYVVDGDTVELVGGERVRLLGIDTPEYGECYFTESTTFVRHWLAGATVRLEPDVTNRDDYDRLLRHVFARATSTGMWTHVNYELVKRGYATTLPIPPDRAYRDEFAAAEAAARQAALGQFDVCD